MNEALKPCPFCGSTDVKLFQFTQGDYEEELYCVECVGCEADTGYKYSEDEAVAAWNSRVIEAK